MADETVATVDENGLITGVCAGETVLTVTVEGLEPLTAQVVVNPDLGSLYGFLLYDFGDGLNGPPLNAGAKFPFCVPVKGSSCPRPATLRFTPARTITEVSTPAARAIRIISTTP